MSLPLDWSASPFGDNNWCFHLHAWRMMDPLIRDWYKKRDPRALDEMLVYAMDWSRFHRAGRLVAMSWHDMASGVRAFKLAFLLERLRRGELRPTAQDEADLWALVDAHASFLSDAENVPDNNHGLIMAVGLRHLGRQGQALGRPSCDATVERSAEHLSRVVTGQYTDEGIHREHSPGYHFFVTDFLTRLRVAELFPEVENVPEIVRRAEANRAWMVYPNREVSRIGDNRAAGEPLTQTSSTRVVGGREYAVGDFTRSGYAIVRTLGDVPPERQSMLFMTAMQNSRAHKHADDLSFELFEAGRRILIDTGSYDFQWDAMRHYAFSAAAHNTVDLVEAPVTPRQTPPYGSGLQPIRVEKEEFVLSGQVKRAETFNHRRTLRYRPGTSLVVEDELDAARDLRYASRLHFSSSLTVSQEGRDYVVSSGDGKPLASIRPPRGTEVRLVRGQKDPLLGWETVERRVMAPAFVLEASRRGRNLSMEWRISLLH